MNILQKNLEALPKLKEMYSHFHNSCYITEPSKQGELTVKLNNIYLHSKYDPIKEANRVVDILLLDKTELDIIILYGCGLGYVARALYERVLKNQTSAELPYIIYIEADIKIFLTSIQYLDWTEICANDHFKFFLEAEKNVIASFIQSIPTKRIRYYYHRPCYRFSEEYYKEVQNYIIYILDRKDMNTATFTRFQKVWTKNIIYNLPCYLYSKPINKLTGIAKNATCIVIAGGPTLENCIPYLHSIKDKVVIIAVDTVYKFLKRHSIIPDVIVTIDPQFWNYKYLENERIDDSIIIAESSVYHKILQIAPKHNYFIGSSIFPIAKYFGVDDNRGILLAGCSVSTTAFDTARIMGCENIILLGLDLSFPERMTHFKGAFFETNFLNFSDYFHTAEHATYDYLCHTPLQVIQATNGKVFTDQKMVLFKKWFDREIPLTNAKVFLPDMGGALLEGARVVSIEGLPDPDEAAKNIFTNKVREILSINEQVDWEEINEKIDIILQKSIEIKNISNKIFKLIPGNGETLIANQKKIHDLEEQLFKDNERSKITEIISSSAQDILLSIIENVEYSKDKKASAWIKTRILYKSIIELTDFYTSCFTKLLKVTKK